MSSSDDSSDSDVHEFEVDQENAEDNGQDEELDDEEEDEDIDDDSDESDEESRPPEEKFDDDHEVPAALKFEADPCCLAFHPSQDLLAMGTIDGELLVWKYSTEKNEEKSRFRAHKRANRGIKYTPDGKALFSISKDKSLKIIDAETMKVVTDFKKAHESALYSVSFIDDWLCATGDEEGEIRIWDHRTPNMEPVQTYTESEDYIADLMIEPDKKKILLAASAEGTLTAIDVRKKKMIMQSELFEEELLSLAFVKGKKVVCGGSNGSFEIFNWEEFGYIVNAMKTLSKTSVDSMVSLTDTIVVYGCGDGNVRAASLFPNKPLGIVGKHSEFPVMSIDLSHDKKIVASASGESVVKFWSVQGLEDKADAKKGRGQDLKMALCELSWIATSTNRVYHSNGLKLDGHPFYERGFNLKVDDICLYGVFSGSGSLRCARHAALTFPAEILLGQLDTNHSPAQIGSKLKETFLFVDKQLLASIDDLLLERVRMELASESLDQQLHSLTDASRVDEINREILSTASGIVAAVINDSLNLAYAGECVAVLAHQRDDVPESEPWVVSVLTCGHNVDNEDEKARLGEQALIDLELFNVRQTRFFGHPTLKNTPALHIEAETLTLKIEENWKFLVLASPGVFEVLSHLHPDCVDISELAELLCQGIREEFVQCSSEFQTLTGDILNRVTENTIDKLGKEHFRAFFGKNMTTNIRPDMTLLIRIFEEGLLQPRPYSRNNSTLASTINNSISSTYESSIGRASNEPINAYVDFSSFIERASRTSSVPSWWLDIDNPTEPADTQSLRTASS